MGTEFKSMQSNFSKRLLDNLKKEKVLELNEHHKRLQEDDSNFDKIEKLIFSKVLV